MTVECRDVMLRFVFVKQRAGMFHKDSRYERQHLLNRPLRAKSQAVRGHFFVMGTVLVPVNYLSGPCGPTR
jgi:hypothetical protein